MKEQINTEVHDLRVKIINLHNEIDSKSAKILNNINLEVIKLHTEIEELEKAHFSLKNIFEFVASKLNKRVKMRRYKYLRVNPQEEVNKLLKNEYNNIERLKDRKNYLETNTEIEIKRRLSILIDQLDKISKIQHSSEYYGAKGEKIIIEKLTELSNEYYLFNNLFLELNRGIKFNDTFLKSAQIDHIVVGPSGVYVIETKNWGKEHVRKIFGDGSYTPYDQVQRSGYIVYRYLNNLKYGNLLQWAYYNLVSEEIKVKSIIAITGSNIPPQNKGYVKVLSPNQLPSYIQKRENILSNELIQTIVEKLRNRI